MVFADFFRQALAPVFIVCAVGGLIAAQYYGVIDVTAFRLPRSPEFDRFSADLPTIGLAFLFGAAGAFVRQAVDGVADSDRMQGLAIGGLVGVIVFFILKSKILPTIMYDNLPGHDLQVSFYGMALLAVFAGMYAVELARWATRRS